MRLTVTCALALSLFLAACGERTEVVDARCALEVDCETSIIVDVNWLEENLGDPNLQLVDTRTLAYGTSRIPGALHLAPMQLAATVDDVDAQAAPPIEAEPVLQEAGLRNGTTVVVYGAAPEYDPARIVWLLSYYDHGDVRYLDGGFAAWTNAGGAVETGDPTAASPNDYTIVRVNDNLRVTGDWVLEQLGDDPYDSPAIQLVDARSPGEYDAGHIPSAGHVQWTSNLEQGFMKPKGEVEALYAGLDPEETTVTYCLSGWRASFAWLTLTWLGYSDVRVYDGSWLEWGEGDFPIE